MILVINLKLLSRLIRSAIITLQKKVKKNFFKKADEMPVIAFA